MVATAIATPDPPAGYDPVDPTGLKRVLGYGTRWTKGGLKKGDRRCIIGSLLEDSTLRSGTLPGMVAGFYETLIEVVQEQYPERLKRNRGAVPSFNDHPDTTWDDVERVIDKAAAKLGL